MSLQTQKQAPSKVEEKPKNTNSEKISRNKLLKQSKSAALLQNKDLNPVIGPVSVKVKVKRNETAMVKEMGREQKEKEQEVQEEAVCMISESSDDLTLRQMIQAVGVVVDTSLQRSYSDLYMEAIATLKSDNFQTPKFYENPRSKLARSKSLNMLKPTRVNTMRMWKGVYRTKDI